MTDLSMDPVTITRRTLEAELASIVQTYSHEHLAACVRAAELNCTAPQDMLGLVVRLNAFVWGERLPSGSFTHPTTWWDAFKLRFAAWMPMWVAPVAFTNYTLSFRANYPDYVPLPPKKYGRVVYVAEFSKAEW